jgi:hypothetical protein
MQKVVGSNPISRSSEAGVADRKSKNGSSVPARRGRFRRDRAQAGATRSPSRAQPETTSPPSEDADANGAPQRGDGDDLSSLLATTGQEVRQLLKATDQATATIREIAETEVPDGQKQAGVGGEGPSLLAKVRDEVAQVLESADEAADKIRAEARAEAHQLIEESRRRTELVTQYQIDRVNAFARQVAMEASALQEQLETLHRSFDQATAALDAKSATDREDDDERGEQPQTTLRRRLGRRRKIIAPQAQPSGEVSEGARLLALQHLMVGEDTEAVEARLRDELGIEDPAALLESMGVRESGRG